MVLGDSPQLEPSAIDDVVERHDSAAVSGACLNSDDVSDDEFPLDEEVGDELLILWVGEILLCPVFQILFLWLVTTVPVLQFFTKNAKRCIPTTLQHAHSA